jgi:hypothetical protein
VESSAPDDAGRLLAGAEPKENMNNAAALEMMCLIFRVVVPAGGTCSAGRLPLRAQAQFIDISTAPSPLLLLPWFVCLFVSYALRNECF